MTEEHRALPGCAISTVLATLLGEFNDQVLSCLKQLRQHLYLAQFSAQFSSVLFSLERVFDEVKYSTSVRRCKVTSRTSLDVLGLSSRRNIRGVDLVPLHSYSSCKGTNYTVFGSDIAIELFSKV